MWSVSITTKVAIGTLGLELTGRLTLRVAVAGRVILRLIVSLIRHS